MSSRYEVITATGLVTKIILLRVTMTAITWQQILALNVIKIYHHCNVNNTDYHSPSNREV